MSSSGIRLDPDLVSGALTEAAPDIITEFLGTQMVEIVGAEQTRAQDAEQSLRDISDEEFASKLEDTITSVSAIPPTVIPPTARPVIIDTDMATDPGDLGALRVAIYYEKAGFIDIVAVVVDTTSPTAAPVVDASSRWAGRAFQIGQVSNALAADLTAAGAWHQSVLKAAPPRFGGLDASQYPDAVAVYRSALANHDGAVDICAIGTLTALAGLMSSGADTISPLTGLELVETKVGHLWVMGGQYPSGKEHNFSASGLAATAAAQVINNWPSSVPVTFLGYEAADTVITHTNLAYEAPANDPFLIALGTYYAASNKGPENGRSAWDECLIRMAALGGPAEAGYTTVTGTNVLDGAGNNTFTAASGGAQEYVVKAEDDSFYVEAINAINVVGQEPVPAGARWRTTVVGSSVPYVSGTDHPASPSGLPVLARMKASDALLNADNGDGLPVLWLPSHGGTAATSWVQATEAAQPIFRADIDGRACLEFAGAQALLGASPTTWPNAITVLARIRFDSVPAAVNTIAAADSGTRIWQLKTNTAGAMQAINFNAGNGRTDTSPADLAADTWHLVAMRYDATSLEALIDDASDGAATETPANTGSLAMVIGAINPALGSPLTGYIADLKVCSGKATDAQLAALAADM